MARTKKTEGTIHIGIRLPFELHQALTAAAVEARRSLNAQILVALEEHVERAAEPTKRR